MNKQGTAVLLASARVPFLLLTLVLVLLGVACASTVTQEMEWEKLAIILLTAVSAHVSVNALNEYFDFRIGLDAVTDKTPFSGGSGALPHNPQQARSVLLLGIASLLVTLAAGLYLVTVTGQELLLPGMAGLLIVALYTPWMTRSPFLSLVMPGAGFGLIMVIGTAYVLAGQVTLTMVLADSLRNEGQWDCIHALQPLGGRSDSCRDPAWRDAFECSAYCRSLAGCVTDSPDGREAG